MQQRRLFVYERIRMPDEMPALRVMKCATPRRDATCADVEQSAARR